MTTMTKDTTMDTTISALGRSIAACGMDIEGDSLDRLARSARELGIEPLLVDVMVDAAEPVPARVRAFARVSSLVWLATDEPGPRRAFSLAC
jgi:hypothetical protein